MLIPAKNLANKLFGPSYPYFGKIISKPCNFTIAQPSYTGNRTKKATMTVEEFNKTVDQHADNLYRFILKNIKDSEKAHDIVYDTCQK